MASAQTEPSMDEILASIRRIISEEDDAPAEVPVRQKLETLQLREDASDEEETAEDTPPAAEEKTAGPSVAEQAEAGEPAAQLREAAREDAQPEAEAAGPEAKAEPPQAETAQPGAAETEDVDKLDDFDPLPEQPAPSGSTMEPAAVAHEQGEVHDATYDAQNQPAAEERAAASEGAGQKAEPSPAEAVSALSEASENQIASAFGSLEENVRMSSGSGRTIEDLVEAMLAPMIKSWLDENLPRIVEEKVEEEVRRIARRR